MKVKQEKIKKNYLENLNTGLCIFHSRHKGLFDFCSLKMLIDPKLIAFK